MIWPYNKLVKLLCVVLLAPTFGICVSRVHSIIHYSCKRLFLLACGLVAEYKSFREDIMFSLFVSSVWGIVAGVLSLVSNICATALIAYKAWYVRPLQIVQLEPIVLNHGIGTLGVN